MAGLAGSNAPCGARGNKNDPCGCAAAYCWFSNGGALAMKYAIDALDDESLKKPQQIVLISPMIGISRFARFSGMAEWTAFLPAFSRAAG